jgi:hypothetical protein
MIKKPTPNYTLTLKLSPLINSTLMLKPMTQELEDKSCDENTLDFVRVAKTVLKGL